MIFTLVEANPTRVRYKVQAENNANSESGVINNNAGGSPGQNLALDTLALSDLRNLVTTGVASTADAKKLLQGEGLTSPGDEGILRAHVSLTPIAFGISSPSQWAVQVDTGDVLDAGNSDGFACIAVLVNGSAVQGGEVYLNVEIAGGGGGG